MKAALKIISKTSTLHFVCTEFHCNLSKTAEILNSANFLQQQTLFHSIIYHSYTPFAEVEKPNQPKNLGGSTAYLEPI